PVIIAGPVAQAIAPTAVSALKQRTSALIVLGAVGRVKEAGKRLALQLCKTPAQHLAEARAAELEVQTALVMSLHVNQRRRIVYQAFQPRPGSRGFFLLPTQLADVQYITDYPQRRSGHTLALELQPPPAAGQPELNTLTE